MKIPATVLLTVAFAATVSAQGGGGTLIIRGDPEAAMTSGTASSASQAGPLDAGTLSLKSAGSVLESRYRAVAASNRSALRTDKKLATVLSVR